MSRYKVHKDSRGGKEGDLSDHLVAKGILYDHKEGDLSEQKLCCLLPSFQQNPASILPPFGPHLHLEFLSPLSQILYVCVEHQMIRYLMVIVNVH